MPSTEWDLQRVARTALGLDAEKFTVFVNAGWEGGGNIPLIFRELVRGELDVQAIFLAGKNEALKSEVESLAAEAKFPIKVIGYSDEVEKLLGAANVMISKLGGLSTFEALSCRVPISPRVAGQSTCTCCAGLIPCFGRNSLTR